MGPARQRPRRGGAPVREVRGQAWIPKRAALLPSRDDREGARPDRGGPPGPACRGVDQPALLDPVRAGGRAGAGAAGRPKVRKAMRVVAVAGLALAGLLWSAGPASAHPLGDFTI